MSVGDRERESGRAGEKGAGCYYRERHFLPRYPAHPAPRRACRETHSFFFFTFVTGPRRFLSLKLSDARVYEPQTRRIDCMRLHHSPPGLRVIKKKKRKRKRKEQKRKRRRKRKGGRGGR